SVTTPPGVIRPIRSPKNSVNHRLPSGPAAIPSGRAPGVIPALTSATTPAAPAAGPAPANAPTITDNTTAHRTPIALSPTSQTGPSAPKFQSGTQQTLESNGGAGRRDQALHGTPTG